MKKLFLLVLIAFSFSNCDEDTTMTCDEQVEVNSSQYNNAVSAHFSFVDISISEDCLEVKISASGCDGASWKLELFDANEILESFPLQRRLKLILENNEACLAVFTKTVSFDLKPIRVDGDEVLLNIDDWDDKISYQY